MTNILIDKLKEDRDFLTQELNVRVDPSNEIKNSPYNEYLADQIEEINSAIYEILTRLKQL